MKAKPASRSMETPEMALSAPAVHETLRRTVGLGGGFARPHPRGVPAPPPLFRHRPSYLDVHPGTCGESSVLSALAALAASDPRSIYKIIRQDRSGRRVVALRRREGRHEGARFPIDEALWADQAPVREPWVAAIEQACAALVPDASTVTPTGVRSALECMTGREFLTISLGEDDVELAWSILSARTPPLEASAGAIRRPTSPAVVAWRADVDGQGDPAGFSLLGRQMAGARSAGTSWRAQALVGIMFDPLRGPVALLYDPCADTESAAGLSSDGLGSFTLAELCANEATLVCSAQVWLYQPLPVTGDVVTG